MSTVAIITTTGLMRKLVYDSPQVAKVIPEIYEPKRVVRLNPVLQVESQSFVILQNAWYIMVKFVK